MRKESAYHAGYLKYSRRNSAIVALLILAALTSALFAITRGSVSLSVGEVLRALLARADEASRIIVWNVRLPRVLAAAVAGAGLSVSGAVMQSVLRNPLASPFTLGISQGAAFGAALAVIGFGAGGSSSALAGMRFFDAWSVSAFAFAGAMAATLMIVAFAKYRDSAPGTMVLAGVALGSLFSAGTVLLQYFAEDTKVAAVVFWTFGDLGRASWRDLAVMGVVTVLGGAYFLWRRWDYNALEMGNESAQGLGVRVDRVRMTGMFVASLVTAVAVAFLGIIGFVGLLGPHLVRRVVGNDYRHVLPASAAAGALLLLAADMLARTIIAPIVLPVGAITSLLGASLFLYLLVGKRRTS